MELCQIYPLLAALSYCYCCVVSCLNVVECPQYDGEQELQQLKRFYEHHAGVVGQNLSIDSVMRLVTNDFMDNPRWPTPDQPYDHQLEALVVQQAGDYWSLVVIHETHRGGAPTWGGSTFRTDLSSASSRVMCPYRDYTNGTYLICCRVVEQTAVLTVTHQHYNYSAYEMYYVPNSNFTRKVNKIILEEVITVQDVIQPLKSNYENCWTERMEGMVGYWMKINEEWEWVVDGCMMGQLTRDQIRSCSEERYENGILALGDADIRNTFFYTLTKLHDDLSIHELRSPSNNLDWNPYRFRWNTAACTLKITLMDYLERSQHYDLQKLTLVNLGLWSFLTRPIVDYVLALKEISALLKLVSDTGTVVLWQPMSAVPDNPFLVRADVSNALLAALNHYACSLFGGMSNVRCLPGLSVSHAWSDQLLCPSSSHTMCFFTSFQVLPPGRLVAESVMRHACVTT